MTDGHFRGKRAEDEPRRSDELAPGESAMAIVIAVVLILVVFALACGFAIVVYRK